MSFFVKFFNFAIQIQIALSVCHNSGVSTIILAIYRRNAYFSGSSYGGGTFVILSVGKSMGVKHSYNV